MPTVIRPMLATLVAEPFSNPEWLFETKWDGVRAICFIRNGKTRFISRNQIEMTAQYPELGNVAESIRASDAILDGEIVAPLAGLHLLSTIHVTQQHMLGFEREVTLLMLLVFCELLTRSS